VNGESVERGESDKKRKGRRQEEGGLKNKMQGEER
jgi:hypothetical protein